MLAPIDSFGDWAVTDIVVRIAPQFDVPALPGLGHDFVTACGGCMPAKVEIDFSRLQFIRPVGVTFLSNFIYWLASHEVRVALTGANIARAPIKYLDDAQFFQAHTGACMVDGARPRGTTLPFQRLTNDQCHWWVRAQFVPWMVRASGTTSASVHPYQNCIAEVLNNTQDHSTKNISSIFVQHFPKENKISISIADFGVGIPITVRRVENVADDADAIVRAVVRGFTAKSTDGNQGIGLDDLLNAVVRVNGGEVTILSLKGHVRFYLQGNRIVYVVVPVQGFCPGTTIDISLKTDRIERIEDEPEDLQW